MILDGLLMFSSAQNLMTGTIVSTNVIDLANARDIGVGDNPAMKLAIYVTTGFATTDTATLQIQAQGSTDNSSFSVYAESSAIAAADLAAGRKLFPIDWPHRGSGMALPRYLRLGYVMGALHFTPGALSAFLVLDRQDWEPMGYPAGITVAN